MQQWLNALSDLSGQYRITLAEQYDVALILDGKSGKALGSGLINVCGIYTAHRTVDTKTRKPRKSQTARDVQGFVDRLQARSESLNVRLQLRSATVFLLDAETQEPLGRLLTTVDGFTVVET